MNIIKQRLIAKLDCDNLVTYAFTLIYAGSLDRNVVRGAFPDHSVRSVDYILHIFQSPKISTSEMYMICKEIHYNYLALMTDKINKGNYGNPAQYGTIEKVRILKIRNKLGSL